MLESWRDAAKAGRDVNSVPVAVVPVLRSMVSLGGIYREEADDVGVNTLSFLNNLLSGDLPFLAVSFILLGIPNFMI